MTAPLVYPKAFVVGCPRSGTTWLHDIFLLHPQVLPSFESGLVNCLRGQWWERSPGGSVVQGPAGKATPWLDLAERILLRLRPARFRAWMPLLAQYFEDRRVFLLREAAYLPLSTPIARQRAHLVRYGELRRLLAQADRLDLHDPDDRAEWLLRTLLDRYFAAQGGPGKTLVEKTPSHLFHTEFLLTRFPEAKAVEVVRDVRDVCVSMDAYKAWMPQDRKFQIWMWTRFVEEGFRLHRDPRFAGRILRLRFEDLKRDPPAEIARLFSFCGLEAGEETVTGIATATDIRKKKGAGEGKHYRKGAVGEGKARLTPEELDLIRRVAGPDLAKLGYAW